MRSRTQVWPWPDNKGSFRCASLQDCTWIFKNLEGQRRLQFADERIIRSIAERIEEQDRVPPVHGGGGDGDAGQVAPKFQFEDLDVTERRVDVEEIVDADEAASGEPVTADAPTP